MGAHGLGGRIASIAAVALLATRSPAQESSPQQPPPSQPPQQTPPPQAPLPASPAEESPKWTFDVSAFTINPPDDDSFASTTVRADRDALHLEGRWNYEALHTGSVWAGWNFEWGKEFTLAATPMAGVVFGDVDGVAPGLLLDATWKWLEFYDESEYVVSTNDHEENYLYSWNELTVHPLDWLRFGLVGQRTRAYDTRLSIDRGLLLGFSRGPVTGAFYWFNPDKDDSYVQFSFGFSF